jgi:hypothetical protein
MQNRLYVENLAENVARGLRSGVMRPPRKSNARQEYRLKQREQIEGSPLMTEKFPRLTALTVTLEYYDATATTKNGEMKCKLNMERARSALWFACPCLECAGGDFDLSVALANAVAEKRKLSRGELRCAGMRKQAHGEQVPCLTLLRYKLNLNYD